MKRKAVPAQPGLAQMERDALILERDFWVNQARTLQNQVQMWQTMYSGLLSEIAKGEVKPDVAAAADVAMSALQAPLTAVEAVRAFMAQQLETTQGRYTPRHAGEPPALETLVTGTRRLFGGKHRG
jgi:hypothetical protein